jgi:hypothetical protein
MFLAVFCAAWSSGQQAGPRADPTKGFDLAGPPAVNGKTVSVPAAAALANAGTAVYPLPAHGNSNGGVDKGYHNVGVIFGARLFSDNLAKAVELFYYVPSNPDNYYREGDYRGSTGRIGATTGNDAGAYFCPEGYVAVGLQGSAGLGIDHFGLICGKLGNLSRVVALPMFGGQGGNAFYDSCGSTPSTGLLTGVRIRSGIWMDSIQGLCQAPMNADAETSSTEKGKPAGKPER